MKKYWQPFIIVVCISFVNEVDYFQCHNTSTKLYINPINDTISKIDTSYTFKYN